MRHVLSSYRCHCPSLRRIGGADLELASIRPTAAVVVRQWRRKRIRGTAYAHAWGDLRPRRMIVNLFMKYSPSSPSFFAIQKSTVASHIFRTTRPFTSGLSPGDLILFLQSLYHTPQHFRPYDRWYCIPYLFLCACPCEYVFGAEPIQCCELPDCVISCPTRMHLTSATAGDCSRQLIARLWWYGACSAKVNVVIGCITRDCGKCGGYRDPRKEAGGSWRGRVGGSRKRRKGFAGTEISS